MVGELKGSSHENNIAYICNQTTILYISFTFYSHLSSTLETELKTKLTEGIRMKKLIIVSVMVVSLGLLSITAVTAGGVQEGRNGIGQAPGTATVPGAQGPLYSSEKLSLEGRDDFTASGVELTATDGKEYDLMYPRFLAEGIDIENGQTIAVEGYLVPGPRWESAEEENYLRLTRVTINGEDYDLTPNFGPAHGPHGARAYGPKSGAWRGAWGPCAIAPDGQGPQGSYPGRGPGMMGGYGNRR